MGLGCFMLGAPAMLGGCHAGFAGPADEQVAWDVAEFNAAAPLRPTIDKSKLTLADKPTGPYRVSVGDVLESGSR